GGKDDGIERDDSGVKAGSEGGVVLDEPVITEDITSQDDEVVDDVEDVETDDIIEEAENDEDQVSIEIDKGFEETRGEGHAGGSNEEEKEIQKLRILAEEFDNNLSAMDKYFNQYILIPEGEYLVGAKRINNTERPKHLIRLPSFYMGKFTITNALFEFFIEKTGYRTTAEKCGYGTVYYGRSKRTTDERTGLETIIWNSTITSKTVNGACWYQPSGPGSTLHKKRNHPVVQVSLEDALAFASWTGKRLPTEDEWEAASRTLNGYVFPWGNDRQKMACNIEGSYIGDTSPVDQYIEFENELGIVDTMGNVLEWTMDISGRSSHEKDGTQCYIVKGGSWISSNDTCLFSRTELESQSHSNILGFRCIAY
ncbi:MAG: SUMF1/EgtB/PvdO family nonheme iron enzyme, partial [Thermodesulfobacteriota bacterium]|nr:SUMF1/EgtB/PvdO family nonheme iron enzyme [Thermodesulfobacteriota bacterium]